MALRNVHRFGIVTAWLGLVARIGSACSPGPPDVRLDPPTGLVYAIDYGSNGGSWAQVSTVRRSPMSFSGHHALPGQALLPGRFDGGVGCQPFRSV